MPAVDTSHSKRFVGLVTPAQVTAWLRKRLGAKPGYVVKAHGIRAGLASVLHALALPVDVRRAWAWWARERGIEGHYEDIVLEVMLLASSLLHLVELDPVSPGVVSFRSRSFVIPDWDRIAAGSQVSRMPRSAISPSTSTGDVPSEADSSDDVPAVVRQSAVMQGPPVRSRVRRRY